MPRTAQKTETEIKLFAVNTSLHLTYIGYIFKYMFLYAFRFHSDACVCWGWGSGGIPPRQFFNKARDGNYYASASNHRLKVKII